jgi:hypothetical protein
MKAKSAAVMLLLCWVLGAATIAVAQLSEADRFFALEWSGGERRGRPNVNGYVINNYRLRAGNVRLHVDALDASGKPTASYSGVVTDVPAGARVYFEVPVHEKAPRYRVTITSWEWREGGGM